MTTRSDYVYFLSIPTRWMDNDVYGHVNNVVYYSYFDTVINRFLVDEGKLDIHRGDAIGLCVESQCRYLSPLAFPETIEAGLRVKRLGASSVVYEIGIFRAGAEEPCAFGHFVHVFVDRASRTKTAVPELVRAALETIRGKEQSPSG